MAVEELKVPQSGESISEVQIGQWRKAVGDYVKADEVLVEIETDKAAIELPAPISGVLKEIHKKDGEEAAVGDVIGLMEEGEAPADGDSKADAKSGAGKDGDEPEKKEKAEEQVAAKEEEKTEDEDEVEAEPEAEPAREKKEASDGQTAIMPAARRILGEAGIDPSEVEGSGKDGRILKEDAERAAKSKEGRDGREEPPAREREAEAPSPEREEKEAPKPSTEAGREEEVVPMTPMRKVIAKNLVNAQQNAALLTTFNEIDMGEVMELRKRYKESFAERHGVKLGFMSFFVRAAVEALKSCPEVNARIEGKHIVYRKYYDVGIAVGGGRGLVVPILRNAENMTFADIEASIADFGRRAQQNKIDLAELQGGTFTISNGGIYGSMLSTPIVNTPQSGILGLHAIQDRAVVRDGEVVVRPMMYVALTYDHRLVDGREAVTFLRRIKDVIERPERILLEI